MTMPDTEWESQHISITFTPCYSGRIRMEISSIEKGLDRRIYFNAQEWADFKSAGDQMIRKACRDDA